METELKIDVATLDPQHRRALEEVIGHQLAANQRLIISVTELNVALGDGTQPAQSLDDWTRIYDGLTDEQIEAVDKVAKTRTDLTRNLTS